MTIQERRRLAQLRTDYRKAWQHLLSEVEILQATMQNDSADAAVVEALRARAERAGADYRVTRDAFAAALLEARQTSEGKLVMTAGCHAA